MKMTKQYSGYCAEYNRLTNEYTQAIISQNSQWILNTIAAMEKHKKTCKICKGEK
jgi:hypothetical protein